MHSHYGTCRQCDEQQAREVGLRQELETERARAYAIESRAREVLRTGEETERELAEARRELDDDEMSRQNFTRDSNGRSPKKVLEDEAALEADLAAMRGALGRARAELEALSGVTAGQGDPALWVRGDIFGEIDTALASSPGAAFPVNNVVACVNCKQSVQVSALNAIRCEPCGAAWLATAREVVVAFGDFIDFVDLAMEVLNSSSADERIQVARALLARPEIQ